MAQGSAKPHIISFITGTKTFFKTHIIQQMMVSVPVHNKKKKEKKTQCISCLCLEKQTTSDLFYHNKKVFMPWFMSLMRCHYSVAVLTIEEELFIVTDRASDWDPRVIPRMVTRTACVRRNCPAGSRIVWNRSNLNIPSIIFCAFLLPRENFFCLVFIGAASSFVFQSLMVTFKNI